MTYRGHAVLRTLIRCHFSPRESTGQSYIYSGSADGMIHIWSLDGRVVQGEQASRRRGGGGSRLVVESVLGRTRKHLASTTLRSCEGSGDRRGTSAPEGFWRWRLGLWRGGRSKQFALDPC
jgi:WD40 repeat protein